ncbi:hypothetical protein M405DRAFT_840420 [Rhizopogon salebrosus TDB-379]|nr:hypothetical protein M405DRAFT_840420 [Rhizopogon salebrosus TDB-379]
MHFEANGGQVQQFVARDSDAQTNSDLLETELPSSKYHYPLATMLANLAKLTPERPALIPRDNDRQAHELGLKTWVFGASALQKQWRSCPFRQSWIPIVRANRARLMLSLYSVTGVKDATVQALGVHP